MTLLQVKITQLLEQDQTDLIAEFTADQQGLHKTAGDRFDAVTSIPVVDPDTGDQVTCDEPERWARLLPLAFRHGDIAVIVKDVVGEEDSTKDDLMAEVEAEAAREAENLAV